MLTNANISYQWQILAIESGDLGSKGVVTWTFIFSIIMTSAVQEKVCNLSTEILIRLELSPLISIFFTGLEIFVLAKLGDICAAIFLP